jgi:hypothetical protein
MAPILIRVVGVRKGGGGNDGTKLASSAIFLALDSQFSMDCSSHS